MSNESITTALRGLLCAKPKGDPCWDALDAIDAVHAGLEKQYGELRVKYVDANRRAILLGHDVDALRTKLDEQGDSMHDGWVELPKGADGEHIHEYDKVDWRDHAGTWHENAIVVAVCNDGCYVADGAVFHVHKSDIRHYHAPTVEDVLREFAHDYESRRIDGYGANESADALAAEYAAKLRLAGDAQ